VEKNKEKTKRSEKKGRGTYGSKRKEGKRKEAKRKEIEYK
jgi:hypothetical protein